MRADALKDLNKVCRDFFADNKFKLVQDINNEVLKILRLLSRAKKKAF